MFFVLEGKIQRLRLGISIKAEQGFGSVGAFGENGVRVYR